MGRFFFKKFAVTQEKSAMKVNTDGVLLGAWCSLPSADGLDESFKVMDVGTGTGVIALMVAQRLVTSGVEARITGIDPDSPSAEEAGDNFRESPWCDNLESLPLSLREFLLSSTMKMDLIVSNPPYFNNSLKAPCSRRSNARHTDNLSFNELVDCSADLISERGALSVILPIEAEREFVTIACAKGFFMVRICRVSTIEGDAPKRVMLEFSRVSRGLINEERLSVQKSPNGLFSDDYRKLTSDFYLKF